MFLFVREITCTGFSQYESVYVRPLLRCVAVYLARSIVAHLWLRSVFVPLRVQELIVSRSSVRCCTDPVPAILILRL